MSEMISRTVFTLVVLCLSSAMVSAQQPPPPPPPVTLRPPPRPEMKRVDPVAIQKITPAVTNQLAPAPAISATNTSGAKILFASRIYDFGRVKAGDPAKFSYIFTNGGTETLEVTGVQPQCGCTAAGEWTKKVEPGKTGEIPLQFNTASYHGQVMKTVTVTCNDPMQPHVLLQVKGNIWKPIEFVPPYTVMNILPDMPRATNTVKIINNMEEPLHIFSPSCSVAGFSVELKTNQPGKEFQVTLSATPPLNPGTIAGKVTVQTSATNSSTLDIPFWASVQAAVMAPPQLMIPSAPLAAKATPSLTIQNNSTNAITVSEPVVNVPGVEAQIKELHPGRIFSIQLSFPEGFEIKPGEKAALTVKTSNPRFSELRVPIIHSPKPIPAVTAAPRVAPSAQLQPLRSANKLQSATRVAPPGKLVLPDAPASAQQP